MLQDIWMAETENEVLKAFDLFVQMFGAKYPKAVEHLVGDGMSSLQKSLSVHSAHADRFL